MRRALLLLIVLAAGCGSETGQLPTAPATPTPTPPVTQPPAVTLVSVQVGTAGNVMTLAPGDTRQLWAIAKYSDNTSSDVTNVALWQSSDPVIATVSSGGVLKAAAEGAIDVFATYEKLQGSLRAEVRKLGCEATTLSPISLSFSAFGGNSGDVHVTTPLSDCRWTARSDADWLRFVYDPLRSGNGEFYYWVPVNNFPSARRANILVTVGGVQVAHTVFQEPPASCSYVVKPDEAFFGAQGGTGAFDVVTTPSTCRWTATSLYSFYGVSITGGASGTGAGKVTYSVAPNAVGYSVNAPIQVAGLSGANPPAQHTVHIAVR